MPHGHCLKESPFLVFNFALTDIVIGVGYFVFAAILFKAVKVKHEAAIRTNTVLLLSAVFVLCGADRFMNVVNIWETYYSFQVVLKIMLSVIISLFVCYMLRDFYAILSKFHTPEEVDTLRAAKKAVDTRIGLLKELISANRHDHRMAENSLAVLMEKIPFEMAHFGPGMKYIFASNSWCDQYGLPDDYIGRSHYELLPLAAMPEWVAVHEKAAAGIMSHRAYEDRYQDKKFMWYCIPTGGGGQIHFTVNLENSIRKYLDTLIKSTYAPE